MSRTCDYNGIEGRGAFQILANKPPKKSLGGLSRRCEDNINTYLKKYIFEYEELL